ncbi:PQQ-dependent sugar dehydrogenase [Rubrivirga marina]|uniref:Glucose/Sorbosone dehydrogenase domain-containing protein n=1 Tax=Rubrivirga marina TaxID=1196024 RepID=A0A271IZJ9_9BACT|nr:PQQ-dependent sugar dehydrogenase [Rubrivirga marina]PAP76666.1 hypothetical protein BSZ37_09535 [Rubrivirga marina]
MIRPIASAVLALALAASPAAQPAPVTIEEATPGTSFRRPVGVEQAPGQPDRLYVIEKGVADREPRIVSVVPGEVSQAVFLDLDGKVYTEGEAGLLGLAFHPDYADNGRVFVYYTAPVGEPEVGVRVIVSRVVEFTRSESDPLRVDPESERLLLAVDQPEYYHNAGTIDFGPDGLLYIALGDGGGVGDPFGNGQDPTTLLGSLLRIDVDDAPEGAPYRIPDSNPFALTDGPERDEIFAYGFRNPFKFDAGPFGVWAGDVGAGDWEEIDLVEAGGNYGWNRVEGPDCYCPPGPTCDPCDLDAYEAPVYAYPHTPEFGNSITGGFVVEDPSVALYRHYVYGDFVTGRVWAMPIDDPVPFLLAETFPKEDGSEGSINVSSIDPAPGGGLYVTDFIGGTIYSLNLLAVATEAGPDAPAVLSLAGPNPFRLGTAVRLDTSGPVRVALVDALGREVAVLWDGLAPDRAIRVPGADLAPGVYAVVATIGGRRDLLRVVRTR